MTRQENLRSTRLEAGEIVDSWRRWLVFRVWCAAEGLIDGARIGCNVVGDSFILRFFGVPSL